MGLPTSSQPPAVYPPAEHPPVDRLTYALDVSPPRREPLTRYVVLFVLTLLTTTAAGAEHYASFYGYDGTTMPLWSLYLHGIWYSAAILGILGAHELGHYYMCRYYRVDASRPYFLPVPWFLVITGTLGAFIRIRQPVRTKRQMFDIGIAGPIAGFVVAVPVLMIGTYLSRLEQVPTDTTLLVFGEPLLVQLAIALTFGVRETGWDVTMHPTAIAAWFGLLATALNLFPIGQLDGGHISYAVFGRRSTALTLAAAATVVALAFVSTSWVVWAVLIVVMLLAFGPRHPPTIDEDVPLDNQRRWLAAFALLMLVLCFTPFPITIFSPR